MFLSMEELLKVGQIVKPQGIKGEVKVIPLTDDVTRFLKLKTVYIDGTIVKVGGVKIASDSIIMSLIGVNDRNSAESFCAWKKILPFLKKTLISCPISRTH